MRITAAQRIQNENRIRAAMDRLLRGEIPPGGNCDIKTLASKLESTAPPSTAPAPTPIYAPNSRPTPPAAAARRESPDPKTAQIERLEADIEKLKIILVQANSTIQELTDFRIQALARIAAQHDEILRLRAANRLSASPASQRPTADRRAMLTPSRTVPTSVVASFFDLAPTATRLPSPAMRATAASPAK